MSAPNVISLDAHKAKNEAMWLRRRKISNNIALPAMRLFVACDDHNHDEFYKHMRELRAIAVRELGLSEVSA